MELAARTNMKFHYRTTYQLLDVYQIITEYWFVSCLGHRLLNPIQQNPSNLTIFQQKMNVKISNF